jgi:hypothetical protein
MRQGLSQKEAVWMAKETLGEASSADLAAYIQENFGLAIKPQIVTVLLGSIQERAALDRTGQATYAKIDQWKLDNPEEAKKMAAVTKRREAARRRKAAEANAARASAPGTVAAAEPKAMEAQATPAEAPEQQAKAEADLPGI